jgi:hypothetical protein
LSLFCYITQDLHQPQGHWQADGVCEPRDGLRVRNPVRHPGYRADEDWPVSGLGLPGELLCVAYHVILIMLCVILRSIANLQLQPVMHCCGHACKPFWYPGYCADEDPPVSGLNVHGELSLVM